MSSSLANLWPEIRSLRVGKRRSLSTRCGLYGACSKTVHLKCHKSCCVAVTTCGQALLCWSKTHVVSSPGCCHLMAAHNIARVAQFDTALIVVLSSIKSTNSTIHPCGCKTLQTSSCQQICPSWIFLNMGTREISTLCLHVVSLGSDDEPMSRLQW